MKRPTALANGLAAMRATFRHRESAPATIPCHGPVVWVLSGGGAMGAAQVGMAMALMESGVFPDVIVGCSAGALNGTAIAMDPTLGGLERLSDIWLDMADHHPLDVHPVRALAALLRRRDHVIDPTPLRRTIRSIVGSRDLADLRLPVHVVTTRICDGRTTWHTEGPALEVLLASAALPGLLPPVELPDGHLHVDGGVTDLIPIDRAIELAPSEVWVLDVAGSSVQDVPRNHSALDVLAAGFAISLRQQAPALVGYDHDPRVHRISLPDMSDAPRVSLRDFTHPQELMAGGWRAARECLERSAFAIAV